MIEPTDNNLYIDEEFFIQYIVTKSLRENINIYINIAQFDLVSDFINDFQNSGKPIKLRMDDYFYTDPLIIASDIIPFGEYRLFTEYEFIDFKLENTLGTWHHYFKNHA